MSRGHRVRLAPFLPALLPTLWLALLGFAGACGREAAPTPVDPEAALRTDRRVELLLVPCPQGGFYDRDLSDPAALLVAKIERARPDPLKRAKEELGLLESRAFPALELAFHAVYTDLMRSAYLENLVDALAYNPSDEAHLLLLEALQHPQESVRSKALEGLTRQARPEDLALLIQRLAIETPDLRRLSVGVLFRADRAAAEAYFLDCIAKDTERDLWAIAAPRLPETESAETSRRCAELYPKLEAPLSAYVAAAAARSGDGQALEFLRQQLVSSDLNLRLTVLTALDRAKLVDECGAVLLKDEAAEARGIAIAALTEAEPTDERLGWMRSALSDPNPPVRAEALIGLCKAGDPEGLSRALAQLQGQPNDLQDALRALRGPMRNDPQLARRALDMLLERHSLEEHRPLQQRAATFKAIGQVPLRAAAEFLHRTGVDAGDERIESLRAHEWLMIQASNTDVAGREYLSEALAAEADPLRRIDLLDALGSMRDELARGSLLRYVEDESHDPFERLFAAGALAKIGPSWEIAPRLKRAAFGMQGGGALTEARSALQCLLWLWY